jgi:hypothetical protein
MDKRINDSIIQDCKALINKNDLNALQEYYKELQESEFDTVPDWPNIFQALYIHACLKKRKEIADWLVPLFDTFDPITKIAYRQMFFYGRFLLSKA